MAQSAGFVNLLGVVINIIIVKSTVYGGVGMACRSSLGCFGCKYLEHYYYSTGNMDRKLKGHITLRFGDDMGCENYESNV